MNRIDEIVSLESGADQPESEASRKRWRAAQLIWEEVEEGTSRRALADAIGKSHTHVRYMYNCWDKAGRYIAGDAYPSFQEIYMSTEVRGEPEDSPAAAEQPAKPSKRDIWVQPDEDRSEDAGHTWITAANEAVGTLYDHPAFWGLLTDEELAVLRTLIPKIQKIVGIS
jgi:hypothetical protein